MMIMAGNEGFIKMNYMNQFHKWLSSPVVDYNTKQELLNIQQNPKEIEERFYRELSFGTGGLRGIIGAGTNRINKYVVRRATQGVVNYLISNSLNSENRSVVVAYDSRHYSDIFALEAALVLAANNFKAYLFDSLRPTPMLSYSVRYLNCCAGIVITASHNPSEYNGYKVYNSDGGQITLDMANKITEEIKKLDMFSDIRTTDEQEAIAKELLVYIGKQVDEAYLSKVVNLSLRKDTAVKAKDFRIVYTPLHGTGLIPIKKALELLGYQNVYFVKSQIKPDGNFPTVKSPNPEEREALKEGINLAIEIDADIVLGTDPDCDRIGVAVKKSNKDYQVLTGNQIGALLTEYIVSSKNNINSRDAIIKTIVTSDLGAKIGRSYGATIFNTLTGFKFIGEKIKEFEESGEYDFLFGYEESYGYLAGTFVRDKDAVIASVLIVEMAAHYKQNGISLLEAMENIYEKYGYYYDFLESFTFKGSEGQKKINNIIKKFRKQELLLELFDDISTIEDYGLQTRYFFETDKIELINLPKSDVIKVFFKDGSWFAVRPSGTEPKLKIYYSTVGNSSDASIKVMNKLKSYIKRFVEI
jgi:phosphoglucomutase